MLENSQKVLLDNVVSNQQVFDEEFLQKVAEKNNLCYGDVLRYVRIREQQRQRVKKQQEIDKQEPYTEQDRVCACGNFMNLEEDFCEACREKIADKRQKVEYVVVLLDRRNGKVKFDKQKWDRGPEVLTDEIQEARKYKNRINADIALERLNKSRKQKRIKRLILGLYYKGASYNK